MDDRLIVSRNFHFRAFKRYRGCKGGLDLHFDADGLKEVWTSFDAFLGFYFPDQNNKEMRKKYCSKYQSIFESWPKSNIFNFSFKHLCDLCPVEDMKPVKPRPPISINDASNLFDILQVSYRIRSNLEHGGNNLDGSTKVEMRNRELAKHAFHVTFEILDRTLRNEGIIR
jgi:hypothetical protein